MKVPDEICRLAGLPDGQPPRAFVRALYDLDGHLGETWALSDGVQLHLVSKRIGGAFDAEHHPLKDIRSMSVCDDGAFAYLRVTTERGSLNLKFSIWDRPRMDTLCGLWSRVSGHAAEDGTRFLHHSTSGPAHQPVEQLTPLTAFCASVHAMIQADGVVEPSELFVMQTSIHNPCCIERGRLWLEIHGREMLLREAPRLLAGDQKLCLLANVAAAGMADGLWRSKEQAWLDDLQKAMGVEDAVLKPVFDVLLIQNGLNVFESDTAAHAGPMAPLTILAASLEAVAMADGEMDRDEQSLIWQIVDDADICAEGSALLNRDGVETVMRHAAMTFSEQQKLCLLANLLKVAMIDGVLRSKEQLLMEHYRRELSVPDGTWDAIHHALMVKNNLTIFSV